MSHEDIFPKSTVPMHRNEIALNDGCNANKQEVPALPVSLLCRMTSACACHCRVVKEVNNEIKTVKEKKQRVKNVKKILNQSLKHQNQYKKLIYKCIRIRTNSKTRNEKSSYI